MIEETPNRYTGRQEVLDGATRAVMHERNASYGDPDQDFVRIAAMVSAMWADNLKRPLTGEEVAQFQICLKLSRLQHSPTHTDSWADIAGYAACGYETADLAQLRRIDAGEKEAVEVVSGIHPVSRGRLNDYYVCLVCGNTYSISNDYQEHLRLTNH